MKSGWKKYSSDDTEYIFRVAGKVPLPVIASAIGRTSRSVQKFCATHGVSVRVPLKELRKHWPDYVPSHWRKL